METDNAKEIPILFSDPISSNNCLTFSMMVPSVWPNVVVPTGVRWTDLPSKKPLKLTVSTAGPPLGHNKSPNFNDFILGDRGSLTMTTNNSSLRIPGSWTDTAAVGLSVLCWEIRGLHWEPYTSYFSDGHWSQQVSLQFGMRKLTHLARCRPGRSPDTWPAIQYHCAAKTRQIHFPVEEKDI